MPPTSDSSPERRDTARLRHHVASQPAEHLQVVQVAEQVLQAFQPLHGPGQPEPPQPLGHLERIAELLQRDPHAVQRARREDQAGADHGVFEFRGTPAQAGRHPARARADRGGRLASPGKRERAGRQVVDVDAREVGAHLLPGLGPFAHDVGADRRHRHGVVRRARLNRLQRLQGHVEFAAPPEQPGHGAKPAPERARLPRVGRTRHGRHQFAEPPARHSRLVDALDLADQGQRPLGEQRAHGRRVARGWASVRMSDVRGRRPGGCSRG